MQAFVLHVDEIFVFSLMITVEHWVLETSSFLTEEYVVI